MADDDADLVAVLEVLLQIVGEALCSHAYRVDIHAVRTCSHDTAETAGTELQVLIERLHEVGLVGIVQHSLNLLASFFIEIWGQPLLCFFLTLSNEFCIIFHNQIVFLNM